MMIDSLLYVEDDMDTQEEVAFFLKTKTKNLFVANDGVEGLEIFKTKKPSLVISDVQMPRKNGLELAQDILSISPNAHIVILTAFNDTKRLQDAISIGIKEYIVKPIDFLKLSKKIDEISYILQEKKEKAAKYQLLEDYKSAVDKSTIFVKMDNHGFITYANDKFCNLLSISKDNISRKTFMDFNLHGVIVQQIINALNEGDSWKGTLKLDNSEGDTIVLDGAFFPVQNAKNRLKSIMGIFHDITELSSYRQIIQTKLEKTTLSLKEKQHYLQEHNKILEIGIATCKITPKGYFIQSSYAFNKLFNFPDKYIPTNSFFDILHFPYTRFKRLLESLKHQSIYKDEIGVKNLKKTFNLTFIGLYDIRGDLEDIVVVFDDVTKMIEQQKKLNDMQVEFLYLLSDIVEKSSEETGSHTKRVSEYSAMMAKAYGLPYKEIHLIKLASIMHDIGKLGIDQNILTKPGRLTPQERVEIEKHAKIGYDMLVGSSSSLLKTAAIIAHEHHEKYDGSGYPRGLKGENIHIYGRIVAIADVFDALSNQRVYKKAWDIEDVYEYIQTNKNKHFDPMLVELFLSNKKMIEDIRKSY